MKEIIPATLIAFFIVNELSTVLVRLPIKPPEYILMPLREKLTRHVWLSIVFCRTLASPINPPAYKKPDAVRCAWIVSILEQDVIDSFRLLLVVVAPKMPP